MKPPYLLALLLVESLACLSARKRPMLAVPEVAAFVVAGLVYALHFLVVPGMAAFYTEWIGFISAGYGAYSTTVEVVLASLRQPVEIWNGLPAVYIAIGCLAIVVVGLRSRDAMGRLGGLFAALALGSLSLFVLQQKGWLYQLLPFHLAGASALAFWFAKAVERVASEPIAGVPLGVVRGWLALGLALVAFYGQEKNVLSDLRSPRWGATPDSRVGDVLRALTNDSGRVMAISTSVHGPYPAITYAERQSAGRFLCAFPLAFFYHDATNFEDLGRWDAAESRFYETLLYDVSRWAPRVILIAADSGPQATPSFFSIPEYLRRRGFFEAISPYYRRLGSVDGLDVWHRARGTAVGVVGRREADG
jgi:hypothetical protein